MTAAELDPALARLAALSNGVRDAVALDREGRRVAGHAALTGPAAELLAAADADAVEVMTERGAVYAVRGSRYALVAVATRSALPSLVICDLRAALAELESAA